MKPDYGQDAPGVVRGLWLGGVILMAGALIGHFLDVRFPLRPRGCLITGGFMLVTAGWMVWSSRVGKQRLVKTLLDRHAWHGDEAVLDIGCGRGLATIEAARRVRSGHVIGLDRWRMSDLSGNTPEAARSNAEAAGVGGQVSVETGEATKLPFADASFDVVVSMTVFHNIKTASGREMAVEEALRVLRPGGTLLIFDILYTPAYAVTARNAGAQLVALSWPIFLWALPGWSLSARKP
jgi:arsenite methyltransferase